MFNQSARALPSSTLHFWERTSTAHQHRHLGGSAESQTPAGLARVAASSAASLAAQEGGEARAPGALERRPEPRIPPSWTGDGDARAMD